MLEVAPDELLDTASAAVVPRLRTFVFAGIVFDEGCMNLSTKPGGGLLVIFRRTEDEPAASTGDATDLPRRTEDESAASTEGATDLP